MKHRETNLKKLTENMARMAALHKGEWLTPARDKATYQAMLANHQMGLLDVNLQGQFRATDECVKRFRTFEDAQKQGEV